MCSAAWGRPAPDRQGVAPVPAAFDPAAGTQQAAARPPRRPHPQTAHRPPRPWGGGGGVLGTALPQPRFRPSRKEPEFGMFGSRGPSLTGRLRPRPSRGGRGRGRGPRGRQRRRRVRGAPRLPAQPYALGTRAAASLRPGGAGRGLAAGLAARPPWEPGPAGLPALGGSELAAAFPPGKAVVRGRQIAPSARGREHLPGPTGRSPLDAAAPQPSPAQSLAQSRLHKPPEPFLGLFFLRNRKLGCEPLVPPGQGAAKGGAGWGFGPRGGRHPALLLQPPAPQGTPGAWQRGAYRQRSGRKRSCWPSCPGSAAHLLQPQHWVTSAFGCHLHKSGPGRVEPVCWHSVPPSLLCG